MNDQAPTSTAQAAGDAAVQVGHVFGQGGTDGLILYALILATFLMFLALVVVTWLAFRAISRRDQTCADQGKAFAEASQETAEALRELASSVSAKGAADAAYQLSISATLARCESVLGRIDPPAGNPDARR